jgi:ATP-dependent Zn protease
MSQPPPLSPEVLPYANPDLPKKPRFLRGLFGWALFIALAVMMFVLLQRSDAKRIAIPLHELEAHLEVGKVRYVDIGDDELTGQFIAPQMINGQPVLAFRTPLPEGMSADFALAQWLLAHRNGAGVGVNRSGSLVTKLLLPLVPWLLIFGVIYFFIFRQLRKGQTPQPPADPVRVFVVNQPSDSGGSEPSNLR